MNVWIIGGLILALAVYAVARWVLHAKAGQTAGWVILYLTLGFLVIRAGFWGYYAFQGSQSEPPGSVPMKGAPYALKQAQWWNFSQLEVLIGSRWLYPAAPIAEHAITAPVPRDARQKLIEGVKKAETLRLDMLDGNQPGIPSVDQLYRSISQFKQQMAIHLSGDSSIDHFAPEAGAFLDAIIGKADTSTAAESFNAFKGYWYGEWDGNEVNHQWSRVETYQPADQLVYQDGVIYIHALQYAWVGDGFGWNIIASRDNDPSETYVLGAVYHVIDQDTSQIRFFIPLVGIAGAPTRLIWLTPSHVFLEEAFLQAEAPHYRITGFGYDMNDGTLTAQEEAFRSHYTRDPNHRPPFKQLPVSLEIQRNES